MWYHACMDYQIAEDLYRRLPSDAGSWTPGRVVNLAQADALGDLLYVVFGAAVTFGIDMGPIFDEIHRSNMTKIGGPVRPDGKRLKPATYEPPNLKPLLAR